MRARHVLLLTILVPACLVSACTSEGAPDASAPDSSAPDTSDADAGLDTGSDVSLDVGFDSSSIPDAGTDAGGPATLDDVLDILCPALARIRCSSPWDCGCPNYGPRPDVAACEPTEAADCRVAFAETSLGAAIGRGAVETDTSALVACLDDLEGSYERCSGRSADLGERCVAAFVNREAGLGDACTGALCAGGSGVCSLETGECVSLPGAGMDCDIACSAGLVCVSGSCAAVRAAGETCFSDADCIRGSSCSGGVCRLLGAVGASCSVSGECALGLSCALGTCTEGAPATCEDATDCASLQRCGFAGSEGRCRALIALGEPCDTPGSCDAGRCDLAAGTCVASGIDAPCSDRADCPAPAICAFSGTCVLPGASGEARVPGFGVTGCEDGLACADDVCVPLPGPGETCIDSRCAAGLACRLEPSGPRCDAPRAVGEPCMTGEECGAEGRCVTSGGSGTCQPRSPVGTSCVFDDECADDLVCIAAGASATCQARGAIGSICGGSSCVDGAFCRAEPLPALCEARVCDHFSFIEL